jgi:hypothetical protein
MRLARTVMALALTSMGIGGGCLAEDDFVAPAQASSTEAYRMLLSGDQRLEAWGAYFAAKNRDAAMMPYLQRMAEEWVALPTPGQRRRRSCRACR